MRERANAPPAARAASGGARLVPRVVQRKCACGGQARGMDEECEECRAKRLQRAPAVAGPPRDTDGATASVRRVLRGGGEPLGAPLRRAMESRFGHDFGAVRVHADAAATASAQKLGALAYTVGDHVVLDAGRRPPTVDAGMHLLAHELTHVVQQSRAPTPAADGPIEIDAEHSPAEREADRVATQVLTANATPAAPRARSAGLSRGVGWAILGGVIGGLVGGLLGAIAGPLGAVLGGLAGAALGAWFGAALSNDKSGDTKGTARQRIHELLTRDAGDWVVSDDEAREALEILRAVEKRDPVELLEIYAMMRMGDEWNTLRAEIPADMQDGVRYFEDFACHPDRGYLMAGDSVQLAFVVPGVGRYSDDQRAAMQTDLAARQADLEALERKIVWGKDGDAHRRAIAESRARIRDTEFQLGKGSTERRLSREYAVTADGVRFDELNASVPVVGLSLQAAAQKVAAAFADPLWAMRMAVDLTPTKRGYKYIRSGVTSPEIAHGSAVTTDTEALMQSEKYARFVDHVPFSLATVGGATEIAVLLYHDEIEKNLAKHEDPEVLWTWARAAGERRHAKLNEPTPAQRFLEFGRHMMANKASMPKDEQQRVQETYSRYIAWLSQHENDPKLATTDPVQIWSRAYVNIVHAEVKQSVEKARTELAQKRRDEAFKQAEAKFDEVLKFAIKNIWPVQKLRSFESSEESISEVTGERVKKGYLIWANPAERVMRDRIASDWLRSVLDRMVADPERFIQTDAKQDFLDYAARNTEQIQALILLVDRPDIERTESKVDIPTWQTAVSIGVSLIPVVGTVVSIAELYSGRDMFGHPMTTTEKGITAVGLLLPWAAKGAKAGKGLVTAGRVVDEFGLVGAEATRVYRIYTGLGPGSKVARLFGPAFDNLKAGRAAVDDPAILLEMEKALKAVGMADPAVAKALMKSSDRQIAEVAAEEVKAVKALAGPMSKETEEMLLETPLLRQALKNNDLAARVLKKCNTPCYPKGATPDQVRRLDEVLERIKKTGPLNEDAVRDFLHARVKDLDPPNQAKALDAAINEINVFAGSKRMRDGSAAADLDAFLTFINNPKNAITRGKSVEQVMAEIKLAHDVGEAGGRAAASAAGLTVSTFRSPFPGKFSQGFDDIAISGKHWDTDLIYILEHKGGPGAKLDPGQMELDWVVRNIQRLYREGGSDGRIWAARLQKALSEGRLRGRAYHTKDVKAPDATDVIGDWNYGRKAVTLGP